MSKKTMTNKKKLWIVIGGAAAAAAVFGLAFGSKIKTLYTSLNSFKDENLAHTFQNTPDIQPTKRSAGKVRRLRFKKWRMCRWQTDLPLKANFIRRRIFLPIRRLPGFW